MSNFHPSPCFGLWFCSVGGAPLDSWNFRVRRPFCSSSLDLWISRFRKYTPYFIFQIFRWLVFPFPSQDFQPDFAPRTLFPIIDIFPANWNNGPSKRHFPRANQYFEYELFWVVAPTITPTFWTFIIHPSVLGFAHHSFAFGVPTHWSCLLLFWSLIILHPQGLLWRFVLIAGFDSAFRFLTSDDHLFPPKYL